MGSPSSQQTSLVMGRFVAMVSKHAATLIWSCRYDEVLVGAPYYSPVQNPEAGRVYVYRNSGVSPNAQCSVLLRGTEE